MLTAVASSTKGMAVKNAGSAVGFEGCSYRKHCKHCISGGITQAGNSIYPLNTEAVETYASRTLPRLEEMCLTVLQSMQTAKIRRTAHIPSRS